MNKSFLLNSIRYGLMMFALSACGLKKTGDMLISGGFSCTTSGATQARAAFYAKSVYSYTGQCASCHTATNPRFQSADPIAGWQSLVDYFSDDEPLDAVRAKIVSPHNEALLPQGIAGFDAQVARYEAMMDQYEAFCASANNGGGGTTPPGGGGGGNINNPTVEANRRFTAALNLGTLNGTLASRTFQMASGTVAPFNTIQIQADFRVYDAGGQSMVLMKNVRLSSPTKAVKVQNIRLKVNDQWKWDDYTNFSSVNATVAQGTTQTSVSIDSQILTGMRANSTDTITISMQIDETTVQPTELQVFVADVRPILMNQCSSCHGGVAAFRFTTATTDQALRDLVVTKINRTTPATSLLFQKAQLLVANGGVAHNGSNTATKPLQNDATSVNRIIAWIGRIQ